MLQFDYYGKPMYSMHARLVGLARVVLALTQILDAFAEYFFSGEAQQYVIDMNYELVRTLAWDSDRDRMLTAYVVLQRKCSVAANGVAKNLNKLKSSVIGWRRFHTCGLVQLYSRT